jgi:hypothetical protein
MSFIPPPIGDLGPSVNRAEEQALELKAEHYAQTHLAPEDRERLGTKPQRLLYRLIDRLRGRR